MWKKTNILNVLMYTFLGFWLGYVVSFWVRNPRVKVIEVMKTENVAVEKVATNGTPTEPKEVGSPIPNIFTRFGLEIEVETEESQCAEYAFAQVKELCSIVCKVSSVKSVQVSRVRGIIAEKEYELTE